MLVLLTLLACAPELTASADPTPASAPASAPAPAAPAAPVAPAAPAAPHKSCDSGKVYWQCPVKGGKEILVCGGTDPFFWMSYVYGKPGAAELVYPDKREASNFAFEVEEVTTVQAQGNLIRFANKDVTYELVEMEGAGGPNGEANNFTGIYVKQGEKLLASIACTKPPTIDWEGIRQSTVQAGPL